MKNFAIGTLLFFTVLGCKESKETKIETQNSVNQSEVIENKHSTKTEITETNSTSNEITETGSSLTGSISNLNIDIRLKADQLFDFDKAVLKPEAEQELQKVFDDINGKTDSKIEIIGHTDSKGSNQYNKNLSEKRAESVKNWLVNKGLKNPIITSGKGASEPIAPNKNADGSDNPDGRAQNRRVDIKSVRQQSI